MRVALELEFPDEQAASVMRQLQNVPHLTIRFLETDALAQQDKQFSEKEPLSEQEQHALLDQVFGSWQSEENGEEMVRRIYADRQDQPREVDL